MKEVHRYKAVKILTELGNVISYSPSGPWVVMTEVFDRVTAERDALQARLNAADQGKDDLAFQLNDREASRYDCFQAAQAAEKRVEELQAQLAERDALLRDLNIISPGQPGCGDFSREQRTWADLAKHIFTSAEPIAQCTDGGMCEDSSHKCTGCAPVERDERADTAAAAIVQTWENRHE